MNRSIVESSGIRRDSAPAPRRLAFMPDMLSGFIMTNEALLIAVAGIGVWLHPNFYRAEYFNQQLFTVIFIVFMYCQIGKLSSFFNILVFMRPIRHADNLLLSIITSFLFLLAVLTGLDVLYIFSSTGLSIFFIITVLIVFCVRIITFFVLRYLSRHHYIGRNIAVLGTGPQATRFLQKIDRDPPFFTSISGIYSNDEPTSNATCHGHPVLGDINALLAAARAGSIDDVVVAMPWSADRRVIATIEALKELPVNVYLGADLVGFDLAFRPVLGAFSQLTMFEVLQRPISGWGAAAKQLMDYALAIAALIVLSPLLVLVAIAIKIESEGPVFFMQQRLGFNNKPFSIYKFRSMYIHDDSHGVVLQARKGDPRVTRVGRVIRATSIDELPQLFNVLDGTMSLVGPRPHALSHNEEYGKQIRGYFARHKVRPGITGWAQVNGLRGETTDVDLMRRRVEYDVYYTENWSLLFDVKIIVTTLFVFLIQKSAY